MQLLLVTFLCEIIPILEVEEDIIVDSTLTKLSCEAAEADEVNLFSGYPDVVAGILDVDIEFPGCTISCGTAAAMATAP